MHKIPSSLCCTPLYTFRIPERFWCLSSEVFVFLLAGLPADTLQGHRDRFQEQFKKYDTQAEPQPVTVSLLILCWIHFWLLIFLSSLPLCFRLKSLFYRSSNLQYFKRLIQIPQLPEVRTTRPNVRMAASLYRLFDKILKSLSSFIAVLFTFFYTSLFHFILLTCYGRNRYMCLYSVSCYMWYEQKWKMKDCLHIIFLFYPLPTVT